MGARGLTIVCAALGLDATFAGAQTPSRSGSPTSADLILTGGKVFTVASLRPWAEAVAIRGDRIVAVGTNDELRRLAARATREIAVDGRVLIPGINDAHDHVGDVPLGVSSTRANPRRPIRLSRWCLARCAVSRRGRPQVHGSKRTSACVCSTTRLHDASRKHHTHRVEREIELAIAPLRTWREAGIALAYGSDGMQNPFYSLTMAITGDPTPTEALSREAAVMMFTRGSAYAEFADREKGALAPGMLADLAVLSQDIFTVPFQALPGTTSVLTMVGGKVVRDELRAHRAVDPLSENRSNRRAEGCRNMVVVAEDDDPAPGGRARRAWAELIVHVDERDAGKPARGFILRGLPPTAQGSAEDLHDP